MAYLGGDGCGVGVVAVACVGVVILGALKPVGLLGGLLLVVLEGRQDGLLRVFGQQVQVLPNPVLAAAGRRALGHDPVVTTVGM